ncbi:MAG: protein kinase, partial [Gemmataceae bacterium]|nr:protein kinase [Gemmataceae bacterium]
KQGLLTPFQAGLLINGKWRGFQIAGGKYKLLQLLGIGGMGKVYLCEHIRMKRLVALKVLPIDQLKDPGAIDRFNREAVAAAALNHPNIVKAHDIDQDGNLHFLVLEYVDGSSLHEIVKKHGPLDIPRACHYIAQAAHGLQHAHELGWVHRDIKPGNLLLDRAGTVRILDMGLARYFAPGAASLTQQVGGSVLGTADYLSPEQAVDSSEVDIRSDIYSLGATLYFLLAGKAPFENGTVTEKLLAHQLKDPESITKVRAETPKGLETVLKKMMEKKPVRRYQTPAAVIEALAPWTAIPIEPPAPEEMPRLSAALESYQSGVPSGPISGISHSNLGRAGAARGGPRSQGPGSLSLSAAKLLSGDPKKKWVFIGGGVGALLLIIALGAWMMSGGGKPSEVPVVKHSPTNTPPPAVVRNNPTPPANPPVARTHTPSAGSVSPAEAARRVNERVTVEFVVQSTGATRDGQRVFLNSGRYGDPDNFTIVVEMKKLASPMSEAGINDPKEHYKNKVIRVTGKVALFKESAQIVVDDMKNISTIDS